MKSMSLYQLKVKLKLVDNESKYYRHAERKYKSDESLRKQFHLHRVLDTRSKARHLHLAYAFLRGLPYDRIEHNPKTKPNLYVLKAIIKEHSNNTDPRMFRGKGWDQNILNSIMNWINGAENSNAHLQS